jgi:TPR repeat protein
MYALGKKVPRKYRKAAEQGSIWGQYCLGRSYHIGEGVAQDFKEAVKWYKKAAENGDEDSQVNLEILCKESPLSCM